MSILTAPAPLLLVISTYMPQYREMPSQESVPECGITQHALLESFQKEHFKESFESS